MSGAPQLHAANRTGKPVMADVTFTVEPANYKDLGLTVSGPPPVTVPANGNAPVALTVQAAANASTQVFTIKVDLAYEE